MAFADHLTQLPLRSRSLRSSLCAHSSIPIPLVTQLVCCAFVLLLSLLPSRVEHHNLTNGPQSTLISPTPLVLDGSARSTRSALSKPPLMANTGVGRSLCASTTRTMEAEEAATMAEATMTRTANPTPATFPRDNMVAIVMQTVMAMADLLAEDHHPHGCGTATGCSRTRDGPTGRVCRASIP